MLLLAWAILHPVIAAAAKLLFIVLFVFFMVMFFTLIGLNVKVQLYNPQLEFTSCS